MKGQNILVYHNDYLLHSGMRLKYPSEYLKSGKIFPNIFKCPYQLFETIGICAGDLRGESNCEPERHCRGRTYLKQKFRWALAGISSMLNYKSLDHVNTHMNAIISGLPCTKTSMTPENWTSPSIYGFIRFRF